MATIKKGHYVPQFYLKYFATDQNRVFVFDKVSQNPFMANVTGVACEKYFYDIDESILKKDADPQLVEKRLSQMEGEFATTLDLVVNSLERGTRFRSDWKTPLAKFLTIQSCRTRQFRNALGEMQRLFAQVCKDRGIDDRKYLPFVPEPETTDEDIVAFNHAYFLLHPRTIPTYVAVLTDHIWLIGNNDTRSPLYTSDNPLVSRGHYGGTGLATVGIEIAFPLTPKYVLLLYERTAFQHRLGQDCQTITLNPDHVKYYNCLQVQQSFRQVFCSEDDFDLARKQCVDNPHICDLKKQRLEMVAPEKQSGLPAPKRTRSYPEGNRRRVGRNDTCPCGSGKKFKKCCMRR